MTAEFADNLPFIFREVAKNELAMLCGEPPDDSPGLLLGRPTGKAFKPFTTLAVLAGAGAPALSDFLALVKSAYLENGFAFPRIITPSPEFADSPRIEELREYLIVYDFVETERQVMVCLKRSKPKSTQSVELAPATLGNLDDAFREQFLTTLRETRHYPDEFREPAFTERRDDIDFQLLHATRDGQPAGIAAILKCGLEHRLQALFVAQEHRGQSVGEALVGEFLERSQKSGAMFQSAVIPAGSNFFFYLGRFNFEPVLKFTMWTPPAPDFFEAV